MFVIGIDPGLTRCGFGAVRRGQGGSLQPVTAGVLETDPTWPIDQRLGTLLADLQSLMSDLHPDVVVVERLFFQANVRTAVGVAQASGLALAVAATAGIATAQYSPNEVKMALTGSGAAPKAQVAAMVQRVLDLDAVPTPPDAADALALAICHHSGQRLRLAMAAQK
jgi:crossover junction endodeoxyribonuclease RuvC